MKERLKILADGVVIGIGFAVGAKLMEYLERLFK